jgi:hypothetical protein
MSENENQPAEDAHNDADEKVEIPLNRAQRRALASGKGKAAANAHDKFTANPGINRGGVPPAQKIQTRGAGRGK